MQTSLCSSAGLGHGAALPRRTPALLSSHLQRPRQRPVVCALSLQQERAEGPGTSSTQVQVVDAPPQALASTIAQSSEELARAYEAGFQAGLAAARTDSGSESSIDQAPPKPVADSLWRSIVKALSWRIFSTATTIVLTMSIFHASMDEALEMGAAEFLSKYILFFIHERLWFMVTFI